MAGEDQATIDKKVKDAARVLNLTNYLERRPRPALRRPAPARRHRPRHRAPALGLPVRRAAVQPRRRAARQHAARDQRTAPAAQDHDDLRHPRPGRGHDHGRQDRRAERRQHRAGRLADGALQDAEEPVRRRLHRFAEDEPDRRRAGRPNTAPRPSASGRSISTSRPRPATGRRPSALPSISAPTPSCMSRSMASARSTCAPTAKLPCSTATPSI